MSKSSNVVLDRTPLRISYAYIFEPRHNDQKDQDEYSCTLLIPKDATETLTMLKRARKAALTDKFGAKIPKGLRHGIRDGDEYLEEDDGRGAEYAGHYFIRCSSTRKPSVLNARKEPAKADEIVSGDYVFAVVRPYAYHHQKSGSKGYAFGLQAIMFAKKGDPLGSIMTESQAQELFKNAEAQVDGFGDDDDVDDLLGDEDDDI